MAFTSEQRAEWRKRPEIQARQREHEQRYREKQNALKPPRCLVCGVFLNTRRKFCTPAHKALHHRQLPGVAEHERQVKRDRYHADADYRAQQYSRTALWKSSHPEARREERQRAHLRKIVMRYAEIVGVDAVMRDLRYVVAHAALLRVISDEIDSAKQAKRTATTMRAHRTILRVTNPDGARPSAVRQDGLPSNRPTLPLSI